MWTQEDIKIIKDNHGKITLQQISKLLPNHSYTALRSFCQRTLKLFRNQSDIKLPNKNTFNMNYWNIPTLKNSFLAGRIAGDGCLFLNINKTVCFSYKCVKTDEEIIDFFIKELNYTGKKYFYKEKKFKSPNGKEYVGKPLVEFSIRSGFENNAKNLYKWFNIPSERKTFRMGPTNLEDINLNLAFIIGLIDSDGNIQYRKENNYETVDFGLNTGCLALAEWFKKIIDEKFPGNIERPSTVRQRNGCYKIYMSGTRAAIIIDYLNKFPLPKLARKWQQPPVLEYISKQKIKYPNLFLN